MEDRELLDLAAKAAGRIVEAISPGKGLLVSQGDGVSAWWNPLTTDGDALRLAVKLNLAISIEEGQSWAHHEQVIAGSPVQHDGKDPCAATRRAIVRAAAEVGKAMP